MDSQDNILYLKQKCNAQLDHIQKLEKILKLEREEGDLKTKKIQELEELLKEEQNKEKIVRNQVLIEEISNDFFGFARVLKHMLQEIPSMKIFIQYKNNCQNARDYYKVSKPELDKFVGDLVGEKDFDKFFRYCAALGVIRSDQGKYVYINPAYRYYMFRKQAFDYIREEE